LDLSSVTPQTVGLWIQGITIVGSAGGVILLILANRGIARRKATLDHIILCEINPYLSELRRDFVVLKNAGNLEQFASRDKISEKEALTIRKTINQHEIVGIGIKTGTFDGKLYKLWYRSTVVADWIAVKRFVSGYQHEHHPDLFCNFERIAKDWADERERKHI